MEQKLPFLPGLWHRLSLLRSMDSCQKLNNWLRGPWYVLTLGVLTAVSSLFGLDLGLYSLFMGLGICIALFGNDLLPLMPLMALCYVSPSRENNPGRYPGSVFYPANGGIYLAVLFCLFLTVLVLRLVFDKELGGKHFLGKERKLMPSMILLGAAYLLSGIGMEEYGTVALKNLVFSAIQFVAIFGMYYFFSGSVHWEKTPKAYPAWTALAMGCVVFLQLMENYLSGRIFAGGTVDRELMATGWGMHNNIGCMMAMTMPFAFYLAGKGKRGWIFTVLGTVLLIGTILSCSRTSMFLAVIGYGLCAFLLLKNPQSRRGNLKIYLITLGVVAVGAVCLAPKLLSVFRLFLSQLGNVSQRDNLLHYGIVQFLGEPVFGGSFYPQGSYVPWDWANLEAFSSFFPPRWHNTLVQLLASCGTVGLTAYLIHRYQTVKLFWQHRSPENTYIAISLGILLCASLLDCHFFNVGPVLLYSMFLAFVENR